MPDVLTTTTQLSPEMMTFYSKVFLEVFNDFLTYDVLTQEKDYAANSGKVVYFTRQTLFPEATTALTEGVNPDAVGFSAENVSATVAEYGKTTKISSLFSLTSIDAGLKEKVSTIGQNAGKTIDTLIKNELFTGATVQFAGGKAALTAVAATDTLSVVELRKAARTLKRNGAHFFDDRMFRGVVSTEGHFNLLGDTNQGNFVAANQYGQADAIKKSFFRQLAGFNLYETNNDKTEASTVTVYSNFLAGKGSIGAIKVDGKSSKIYHKMPGANDTSNPLDMYSTLGWKIPAFAVKTLNSNWLINVKSGS